MHLSALVRRDPATASSERPLSHSRRRRVAKRTTLAAAAAAAVALLGLTSAAPASASQYTADFDAYCNANHAVTAWAPDITHEDNSWAVVWAPTRYRWNGTAWAKYRFGASQVQYGGAWIVQSIAFTGLPSGYYQVRDTYSWLHYGQKTGAYGLERPVLHRLDGRSYYYGASVPTWQYSTPSYCYMS